MSELLVGILGGIVVSLFAWGAKQIFSRRQLYVIQPKLFDYSGLDDHHASKTIELTVLNSGRRPEESIRVQLAPHFDFSVVASSIPNLEVADGILAIDRLAPREQLTVILFAEGGEFRKDHLIGVSSKDTVGKVKASLQEASATSSQALAGLFSIFFIVMPFGYGVGKFIEKIVWPQLVPVFIGKEQSIAFEVKRSSAKSSYSMQSLLQDKLVKFVEVRELVRRGDDVLVKIHVDNKLDKRIGITVEVNSPLHDQRSEFSASSYIIAGAYVFPDKGREFVVGDYLPSDTDPQAMYLKVTLDYDGSTVWIEKDLSIKKH